MPGHTRSHLARPRLVLGLTALVVSVLLQLAPSRPAAAAVTHLHGFRATVDGFTSWYGSYGMGTLGTAWCIDHGIRSPDPTYAYVPAELGGVPDDVRTALAWAVSTYGEGTDPVQHAGLMLALHDLMDARYPSGPLDVDQLAVARLAGFGGVEAQVLAAARAIKADALAHAALRGPLQLSVTAAPVDAQGQSALTIAVRDATGQGVPRVPVHVTGAGLDTTFPTRPDGTIFALVGAAASPVPIAASARVPRLPVDAWAPTTARAQRVARPVLDELHGAATIEAAHGELVILKRGDASAWLPVTGATFHVEPDRGGAPQVLTVGADGRSPALALPVGTYHVTEVTAPPGYQVAGPWTATVEHGRTTTIEVTDAAQRGALEIVKVDADSGEPLAGAALEVRYDADADGVYEQLVTELVTDERAATLSDLLPGRYQIVETRAPGGYQRLDDPLVAHVDGGVTTRAVVADVPAASPPTTAPPPPPPAPPTTAATAAPTTTGPAPQVLAAPVPPRPPEARLPRTGVDVGSLTLVGTGLVLVGRGLLDGARGLRAAQPKAPSDRRAAIRSSS